MGKKAGSNSETYTAMTPPTVGKAFFEKIYYKLKKYEEMERQGRLKILPCKPGDTVYILKSSIPPQVSLHGFDDIIKYLSDDNAILCGRVVNIKFTEQRKSMKISVTARYTCEGEEETGIYTIINLPFSAIGKTIFLTEEEALQVLKKQKEVEA